MLEQQDQKQPSEGAIIDKEPPKSMVHSLLQEIRQDHKMKFVSRGGSVLMMISLASLIFLTINWTINPWKNTTDKVIQLPETGSSSHNTTSYYAPELHLSFDLPLGVFSTVRYQNEAVLIEEISDPLFFAEIKTYSLTTPEKIIKNYQDKYQPIYSNIQYFQKEAQVDNIFVYQFYYSDQTSFINGYTADFTKLIMIKSFAQDQIVLEYTIAKNDTQFIKYYDIFFEVIKNAKMVTNVEASQATVDYSIQGLGITINTIFWQVKAQEQNSLTLQKSPSLLSDGNITAEISLNKESSDFVDSANLIMLLNEFSEESKQYNPFLQTKVSAAESIVAGLPMQFIEMYDSNSFNTQRIYLGYDTESGNLIKIIVKYPETYFEIISQLLSSLKLSSVSSLPDTGASQTIDLLNSELLIPQLATVKIFNRSCALIEIVSLNNSQYEVCGAGLGSGFIVNSDGILITNAHVSSPNKLDLLVDAILYGYDPDGLYDALTLESVAFLSQKYPDTDRFQNLSNNEFDYLIKNLIISYILVNYQENNLKINNFETENYVQNNAPFKINSKTLQLENSDTALRTEFLAAKEIRSYYQTVYGSKKEQQNNQPDLTILKLNPGNYPVLNLDANLSTSISGITIYAIGYPGISDKNGLFSPENDLLSSVTKGTVSAVRKDSSNTYELFEIDSSLTHGMSGGPLVSISGEAMGVITYMLNAENTAQFNLAVSTTEVSKFLTENNIITKTDRTNELLAKGVEAYNQAYYTKALKYFKESAALSPLNNQQLSNAINSAESQVNEGNDKTPLLEIGPLRLYLLQIVILATTMLIFLSSFTGLTGVLLSAQRRVKTKVRKAKFRGKPHSIIVQTQLIGNPL